MKKIGFIGMGIMGLPMAINLVKKSKLPITGFDVVQERRNVFKENGGISVGDMEKIIKSCDIIFLCLPTNNLVKSIIEQIIDNGIKGTIIIDLSSTAPNVIREMYLKSIKQEIHLIDSPVSGGEKGAIEGTLAIMCGGDKDIFDEIKPILFYIGDTVTYMGESGCGSVAKLANNMIVGCNIGAVSEALAFVVKAGLNPEVFYNAIKNGFAGSEVLNSKAPKIISRDFKASARISVHQKDLNNAVSLAEELGVEIPMSKMILNYMDKIEEDGKNNEDHCAIVKVYEKNMGVVVE